MIFQEKCCSCYIVLTEQILLPDILLETVSNMCTAIVYFSDCDVINFEINLLIKLFFYMTKKLRLELNILRTQRAFKVKWKAFSSF